MQYDNAIRGDTVDDVCSLEVWRTFLQLALRATQRPTLMLDEFQDYLTSAELDCHFSEFYALGLQAIFHMATGSEHAAVYLEMADLLIRVPLEQKVMQQWRRLHEQAGRICAHFVDGSVDEAALLEFGTWLVDLLRDASRMTDGSRPRVATAPRPGSTDRHKSSSDSWPHADTGH